MVEEKQEGVGRILPPPPGKKGLILQSYSLIFIELKHIDGNLVKLIWTTINCEISSVSGLVTKLSNQ